MTVINVYCPRADPEREDRKAFKQRFYQLLQVRAESILRNGSHVIILGDVNTSHRKIDHCDPDESEVLGLTFRIGTPLFKYIEILYEERKKERKKTKVRQKDITVGIY